MNVAIPAFLAAVSLLTAPACTRRESPSSPPRQGTAPPGPPPAPNLPHERLPPLTPDQIRDMLVTTEAAIIDRVGQFGRTFRRQVVGTCYGGPAYHLASVDEVVPWLKSRLTGKALDCYLASYFGCRIGDSIAIAGVALHGPNAVPHTTSAIAIVEQTPDRIVVDVAEAPGEIVDRGILDTKEARTLTLTDRSRYTLVRSSQDPWRIADRVPSFKDWECRPQ